MATQTLLRLLVDAGLGSRRKMAEAIKQEKVKVNGVTVTDFRYAVDTEKDRITVDGKPVEVKSRHKVYLLLNKPSGVTSTTSDELGRQAVLDVLPPKYRDLGLYPAGRLDRDSTGLLLLTNDGELTYRLTHPRFEHEKEYLVQISGDLTPAEKDRLEKGIELEDGRTHPVAVRRVRLAPYNYSITMHEGRKRQVRLMFAALGRPVTALKRVRIGSLVLGSLQEGKVRELSALEVKRLLNSVGLR